MLVPSAMNMESTLERIQKKGRDIELFKSLWSEINAVGDARFIGAHLTPSPQFLAGMEFALEVVSDLVLTLPDPRKALARP